MEKPILALFDFCDTLIDGQSINFFLDFLYQNESNWLKKINLKMRKLLAIVSESDSQNFKNYLFAPFRGISKERMERLSYEFTQQVLLNKEHPKVTQRLQWHNDNGHTIVLLSGGFEAYLKYYASIYNIKYVIGTPFLYDSQDYFQGIGQECLGVLKVEKLAQCVSLNDFDLQNSYAYSDAESDIPMFKLVGNCYVIKNKQDVSWKETSWNLIDISIPL
ncbi:MAG: HAD-IB family hydrolase [Candidatus Kapaibacterium sp.]